MNLTDTGQLTKFYDAVLARRLLTCLRPYRRVVGVSVTLLLILSGLRLVGPYLLKIAIDESIPRNDTGQLQTLTFLFVLVLFLQFGVGFVQTYATNWTGQRIMHDLRLRIFRHIQKLDVAYFDKNSTGSIITRLTNDVDVLNELFTSGVVSVFGDVFSLLGIVVVMLWINWKLALVCFSVIPLLFIVTLLFKQRVRGSYRRVRAAVARINAFLQEMITGMPIVQVFVQEERKLEEFKERNREHRQANLDSIFYYAIFYPVVSLIGTLALALILWYGGLQVLNGVLTLGAVVAFVQYSERFYKPISDLSEKFNILQSAMASSERIFDLLDTRASVSAPAVPQIPPQPAGSIEFRNVSFRYDANMPILKNLSFRVDAGEKVAIVGATGAGKTTLISLLSRFYDVDRGHIAVDGVDLRLWDPAQLRQRIAVVLQDVFLFSGSVADNIRLWDGLVSDQAMKEAAHRVLATDFIESMPDGFATILNERGQSISSGQRQLLSFARALARNPEILVLDEATSSVDPHTEHQIQIALAKLIEDRTALIIAHRLSTIQNCNRILVLHKGELVEEGSHVQLLAREGIYFKLYQLQFQDQLYGRRSAPRKEVPGA